MSGRVVAGLAPKRREAKRADFHQAIDTGEYPRILALKQRLEADRAVVFAHATEDGIPVTEPGAMIGLVPVATALRNAIKAA